MHNFQKTPLALLLLASIGMMAMTNSVADDDKTQKGTIKAAESTSEKESPEKKEGQTKAKSTTVAKPDVTLELGVTPAVMQFDKKELTVKAGQNVKLIFKNEKCPLQHNFLLIKPGTTEKVGALADKMITQPDAMAKGYIPESDDILVKSGKLIGITQSEEHNFKAPETAGDYPYICTFPGHWRLMKGILKVTAK